jgi:carboxyl-terminal processing protease
MIETVYPHSPGEAAGLKVGDIFYSIDGKTVAEIGYLNAVYHIRGKIGSTVEITVIRDGKYVTVTATRDEIEEINVDYEIDESNNIGYVQIVAFKKNTAEQFIEAIDALEEVGVDGIIFDLRGNPGGYVQSVCDVISYLIPSGNLIVSYQYKGRDAVEILSTDNGTDDHVLDLPFVVICDSNTASSGEIFTSAIRDYRNEGLVKATLVGTTTYKKGIMQNTYPYIDNSTVTLTVAYYNPPCGVNYHGIGVSPDVFVENTTDEDLQLVVAKNELLKLISDN